MNISANEENGVLTFIPLTEEEEAFLTAVKTTREVGGTIRYNGRSGADIRSPYSERMVLKFNLDQQELKLQASSDESEEIVRQVRDSVYLSGGSLIFQGHEEVNGKLALHFCVIFCELCKNPIIDSMRAHWKVCNACAEKCSHEYKEGMVNNGGLPGYGEYCSKCGRGKPPAEGERKRTKIEQELDIQNKLGIKIAYKGDNPPHSPEEAIEMNRFIKRYKRSKSRR